MLSPDQPNQGSAGFTLIELLVSLALFALISLAGLSLIETVTGVQQRTEGRSERLADVQRALFLVTADFEQLTSGPLVEGDAVSLTRGSNTGSYPVSYRLLGGALARTSGGAEAPLLTRISALRWRYFKGGAWTDQPSTPEAPERPSAVELTLEFLPGGGLGPGGPVRRVIELPAE